jgi:hypothetical protein
MPATHPVNTASATPAASLATMPVNLADHGGLARS